MSPDLARSYRKEILKTIVQEICYLGLFRVFFTCDFFNLVTKAVFAGELRKTVKSFILLTFLFFYNINDFAVKIILSLNEVKEESKFVAILFVCVFVYL